MDPFSIALALSLMLGSTYFKKQSMDKTLAEQQRLSGVERAHQGQLEQEKQAAIQGALPQLSRPSQEAEQQSIAGKMRDYMAPPASVTSGDYVQSQNPGSPTEVRDRQQAVMNEAAAKGRDYAARLADVSSYNLLNFGNSALMNRTGEKVGNAVTSQTHSSQILPFELQAASRVGRGDALTADLLGGAGSIAGMYAIGGPTAPAGGVAGGTGITVPESGYLNEFGRTGLNPNARGAAGLRIPNMYGI